MLYAWKASAVPKAASPFGAQDALSLGELATSFDAFIENSLAHTFGVRHRHCRETVNDLFGSFRFSSKARPLALRMSQLCAGAVSTVFPLMGKSVGRCHRGRLPLDQSVNPGGLLTMLAVDTTLEVKRLSTHFLVASYSVLKRTRFGRSSGLYRLTCHLPAAR